MSLRSITWLAKPWTKSGYSMTSTIMAILTRKRPRVLSRTFYITHFTSPASTKMTSNKASVNSTRTDPAQLSAVKWSSSSSKSPACERKVRTRVWSPDAALAGDAGPSTAARHPLQPTTKPLPSRSSKMSTRNKMPLVRESMQWCTPALRPTQSRRTFPSLRLISQLKTFLSNRF